MGATLALDVLARMDLVPVRSPAARVGDPDPALVSVADELPILLQSVPDTQIAAAVASPGPTPVLLTDGPVVALWSPTDAWLPILDAFVDPVPEIVPFALLDPIGRGASIAPVVDVQRPRVYSFDPPQLLPLPAPIDRLVRASTERWAISGTTRDSGGTPLGSCRVVALDVGQLQPGGVTYVAEVVSDGGGLFSITVPQNTDYQLIAYKPGSPDVAGISLASITPAQV